MGSYIKDQRYEGEDCHRSLTYGSNLRWVFASIRRHILFHRHRHIGGIYSRGTVSNVHKTSYLSKHTFQNNVIPIIHKKRTRRQDITATAVVFIVGEREWNLTIIAGSDCVTIETLRRHDSSKQ